VGQTVCKPGSVRRPCGRRDDHSSGPPIAGRFSRPTRTTGPVTILPEPPSGADAPSLFGLAPGGACHAVPVARSAVGSYPTLSPLPAPLARLGRFAFCGAIPRIAPGGRYPPPCHCGARTFLDAKKRRDRPTIWPASLLRRKAGQGQWGPSASAARRSRATRRALVSPSAWPSTVSGRQWRWKATTFSLVSSSY
jgi:hypothetical protein